MSSGNPDPLAASLARAIARRVGLVFLRLGTTAFGGPAAHIAMMEQEFVSRRRWLSRQQFRILALIHVPHFFASAQSSGQIVAGSVAAATPVAAGPGEIFLYFLKIGSVLYGSGYVLLGFLQGDLVPRWLTGKELLDAVSVGQVTPGPLFTTATFIGFLLGYRGGGPAGGWLGAVAGTVGIFLPAFVLIALGGTMFPRLRKSPLAGSSLDGVNVAALALIVAVAWTLGREALVDIPTVTIAIASGLLLFRCRWNSAWLILGGGVIGVLMVYWSG